MSDKWDFYFCRVNDVLSSLFVDLGARNTAPDPDRPHLLWVWVPFRQPREDGLSSSEEAPTLDMIEDELVGKVSDEAAAVFVGRITGAGRREFYFYAPGPGAYESAVEAVSASYPAYEMDFGDQPDPDWSLFLDVLYPGPRDIQRMRNREVVQALEAEGDSLDVARPVTHWIYFREPAERAVAAERLIRTGFQTEQTEAGQGSSDGKPGLRIERMDRVDSVSIDTTVLQILDALEGLDAEYDGWECPVIKQSPNASGLL